MEKRVDVVFMSCYAGCMANTRPKTQTKALNMKVDDEFLESLERVRHQQKPALSKSDCVRKLVFEADRKGKARK